MPCCDPNPNGCRVAVCDPNFNGCCRVAIAGIFGVCIMSTLCMLFWFVPGPRAGGKFENFNDAILQARRLLVGRAAGMPLLTRAYPFPPIPHALSHAILNNQYARLSYFHHGILRPSHICTCTHTRIRAPPPPCIPTHANACILPNAQPQTHLHTLKPHTRVHIHERAHHARMHMQTYMQTRIPHAHTRT